MARDRKPKLITVLLELEDNCGQILAKAKKEIVVEADLTTEDESLLREQFITFVQNLPTSTQLSGCDGNSSSEK